MMQSIPSGTLNGIGVFSTSPQNASEIRCRAWLIASSSMSMPSTRQFGLRRR